MGAPQAARYASRRSKRGHRRIEEPDWAGVHRELMRKHVTVLILWDEYIAADPGGYSYSRFCELYRAFEKALPVTMRQMHAAGERLFVDYAGDGVPVVVDRLTREMRLAQIFVAVLGASSFIFAKATWTQALPDWIDAHVRAFEAIGGVPELVVPDNAKTAIVKASFYGPEVNRTYAEMAAHYGTAILPARPRKSRDKAKVEQAVRIVQRWLLGRLRRRTFYSLPTPRSTSSWRSSMTSRAFAGSNARTLLGRSERFLLGATRSCAGSLCLRPRLSRCGPRRCGAPLPHRVSPASGRVECMLPNALTIRYFDNNLIISSNGTVASSS
jgi:transposase